LTLPLCPSNRVDQFIVIPAVNKAAIVGLLVVWSVGLTGCGRQNASPTASTTASPSPLSTPSSTVIPAASQGSSPAALSCRLPVFTASQAGWLTFPGGSFQSDPKGNVQLPGWSSPPFFWKSYDKAFERWLPVPRDSISPDGNHYAYADPPADPGQPKLGGVHVVDLASGVNHLYRPAAEDWIVLDYEAEGVYLAEQPGGPAPAVGLWLLDPSGSHPFRQIDPSGSWDYISGGAAWGTAETLTPGPGGSRLVRLDLKSGAIVSWYKRADVDFVVTGADSLGHPLLQTKKFSPTNQMLLVTGQNSASVLQPAAGSAVPGLSNYIHPVSDAHGLWLGDAGGSVSLYTPTVGIQQVAHVGTGDVLVAGGCH